MADPEHSNKEIEPVEQADHQQQRNISSPSADQTTEPSITTTISSDISGPESSSPNNSGTKRAAPDQQEQDEASKKTRGAVSPIVEEPITGEVIDMAVKLGFQAGDRLEVEWDISNDDADGEAATTRWWSATLLPFDGRTNESVAIRTLEYDAYPQGGFPETSREDVVFVNRDTLVDPDTQDTLTYRRIGEQQDPVYSMDEIEPIVDQILQGALAKNQAAWSKLPAAQQALIASKIASKKEKLVQLLQQQTGVITPQSMQAILAQTMMAEE